MNSDDLVTFAKQYEEIKEKAEKLFDKLEALEKKYTTLNYRYTYDFDAFDVLDGCIDLKGSYSYQGDWGNKEYTVPLKSFSNEEEFLRSYEQMLIDKLEEHEKKEAERKIRSQEQEYQKYLDLKMKFEM